MPTATALITVKHPSETCSTAIKIGLPTKEKGDAERTEAFTESELHKSAVWFFYCSTFK